MAITWGPIETALEAKIANDAEAATLAACENLKVAFDAFFAEFFEDTDESYLLILSLLGNISDGVDTASGWLTTEQIVECLPADMSEKVAAAFEAMAVIALPASEVVTGDHKPYLIPEDPPE